MKNIIFDLGNVLVLFDPSGYVNKSVSPEKREKFLDVVFKSAEWKKLDLGTLSYENAKKIFKEKLQDCDIEVDMLFGDNLYGLLKPIMKNTELLKNLKKKSHVCVHSFRFLNRNYVILPLKKKIMINFISIIYE